MHLSYRSTDEITIIIHGIAIFSNISVKDIFESIEDVLSAGSRYTALEINLGKGSVGVLGVAIPEIV